MKNKDYSYIIADDVSSRNGISIEIYKNEDLVLEIFRDDTDKKRTIRVFEDNIDLDIIEESILLFKKNIPWDFIEEDEE
ncbi:hypothetical protein M2T82_06055 [Elizabethkingia ursingii]|uniref:hypothetical protein n=1 Tax=Elizabethkingia ursingii TaxID=1756150 RepID=UPI00201260BC|nr:hypothetical protein [Elizabethkingia ursingii]MCL1667623.1 hypothetical protein [Elizabethkingia ursingii]